MAGDDERERRRLAVLTSYDVLDTPPEAGFDRITAIATRALGVPIALVSLVDDRRQWFKSCIGLDVRETPRGMAFCAHAIEQDQIFVVRDTLADPRFRDNPLVRGEPKIRSYAGAPLIARGGMRLGTVCAIDRRARDHTPAELAILVDLAALAVELLEKRVVDREQSILTAVAATSPGAAYVLDVGTGAIRWASANAYEVFGFDPTHPPADATERVHPDDRHVIDELARSAEHRVSTYRLAVDGRYRWLMSRQSPFARDGNGAIAAMVGVVADVTELKEAEQRVHASEAALADRVMVLEGVLRIAAEGIIVANPDGRIALVNAAARDLLGDHALAHRDVASERYVAEAGIFLGDGTTPATPAQLPVMRALAGEPVELAPMVVRNAAHPEGVRLQVTSRALVDARGEVRAAIATLIDVTALTDARDLLARTLANKLAILDALPIGLFVQRGDVVYANAALAAMLGRAPDELVGRPYTELLEPSEHARVAERVARVRAGGTNSPAELLLRSAAGPVSVEAIGLRVEWDEVDAVLVACRDVRAEREAQQQLRDSLAEKETLLKEIHHRVKNNLAVVSSLLFIQARGLADPMARAALEQSQVRVRAIGLVHDHLYRSKDLSRVDLAGYLHSLLAYLAPTLGTADRGIALALETEPVELDLERALPCGLVVNELVTNAVKHAFPDRRGRVVVSLRLAPDAIELAVTDDGVGLAPAPGAAPTLGLELCTMLCRQLRTTLALAPASDGHGTRAAVRLPRSAA